MGLLPSNRDALEGIGSGEFVVIVRDFCIDVSCLCRRDHFKFDTDFSCLSLSECMQS